MLVDTVAFPAYTRAAIAKAGPYDEELVRNQDDEYNYRLRGLGGKILLSPDVKSRYYSRSTIRSVWRQYYQYGYYKVRVMQKHPRQMHPRQFAPPVLVASLLGGAMLAPFSRVVRGLWLSVVALYAVVNLAASFQVASRKGTRFMRWQPVVFATLHFSYGLGFLVGLVKFAGRWQSREKR
jgi:succinoglycan biosynthesis protein ExoA